MSTQIMDKVDKTTFLYEKIIDDIRNRIANGNLRPGEKLPSVRKLSRDWDVSVSTVLQSYIALETIGLIEAKPQSGYYIRYKSGRVLPEPETPNIQSAIKNYGCNELVTNLCELSTIPGLISLGAGIPGSDVLPTKTLNNLLSRIARSCSKGINYEFPPGNSKLRHELAKRTIEWGGDISQEDIIITNGATEALSLSLQAVAKAGDTILTESPTYYGVLQLIENFGMHALEIPTRPKDGIDIDAFKKAIKNHKVAACILYPSINNPLGSIMPDDNKRKVYEILSGKDIPLIEGDVYGELYFGQTRPKPIKSLDKKGLVLYSSSFKTIAPGYRVGWVCPGRYFDKVKKLKYMSSLANASFPQMAMAEFLRTGGYERCIRNLRKKFISNISIVSSLICEYFPDGTKISKPQGGHYLWIELPENVNSIKLQRLALKENISIAPGPLFSTKDDFLNYIRLSCACSWSSVIDKVIKTLGELCKKAH